MEVFPDVFNLREQILHWANSFEIFAKNFQITDRGIRGAKGAMIYKYKLIYNYERTDNTDIHEHGSHDNELKLTDDF